VGQNQQLLNPETQKPIRNPESHTPAGAPEPPVTSPSHEDSETQRGRSMSWFDALVDISNHVLTAGPYTSTATSPKLTAVTDSSDGMATWVRVNFTTLRRDSLKFPAWDNGTFISCNRTGLPSRVHLETVAPAPTQTTYHFQNESGVIVVEVNTSHTTAGGQNRHDATVCCARRCCGTPYGPRDANRHVTVRILD
jgi:hypothetical protein